MRSDYGSSGRESRILQSLGEQHRRPAKQQRIYIGEVVASAEPVVLQTLLGSCVAVSLYDPLTAAGGMNHILLPGSATDERKTRFGVQAMEVLINLLMRRGGERRRFVAKAFGAANVLPSLTSPTVGDLNAKFVRDFLADERIPLVAQRLGGTHAVQVHFRTDTGRSVVHSVDGSRLPAIVESENTYSASHLASEYFTGDATIF